MNWTGEVELNINSKGKLALPKWPRETGVIFYLDLSGVKKTFRPVKFSFVNFSFF